MQKKQLLIGSICLLLISAFSACYYDNEEDLYGTPSACEPVEVRYSIQVKSILQTHCYACHSTGSNIGNLLLDSHTAARASAISGALMGSVNHRPGFSPMPQNAPKIPACDIEALQTWVDNGTPNN